MLDVAHLLNPEKHLAKGNPGIANLRKFNKNNILYDFGLQDNHKLGGSKRRDSLMIKAKTPETINKFSGCITCCAPIR